jgi:2-enoate reductase
VVTAQAVLEGKIDIGENIVIIGAGGTGVTTGLYLAKMGKKVTLVEMLNKIGVDMGRVNRWINLALLKENHVVVFTNTKLEEVVSSGVVVSQNGVRRVLETDSIVLAMGVRSENRLLEYLKSKRGIKVHAIGDCKEPRKIINAIHEAWEVASQI